MKSNERKLILCRGYCKSSNSCPRVLLKGIWFNKLGFNPGDQIVITSPEDKTLVIKVLKPAEEVNKEREIKEAQKALKKHTFSDFKYY